MTVSVTSQALVDRYRLGIFAATAAIFYALFYFMACGLPVVGYPTFRIDFLATTITRGDEASDLIYALWHSRPVAGFYAFIQAFLANAFLDGQARFIIYPLQHAALFIYFFCITKVLESVFQVQLGIISLLAAWVLFAFTPLTVSAVYKLETIVGTLSMLFGGLSMLALVRWRTSKSRRSAIAFLGFYALSIFAKEDFALPPLLLLAWYLISDGIHVSTLKNQLVAQRWLIVGLGLVLVGFLIFNLFLIPGRAFITPVNQTGNAYNMTLDPESIYAVASRYAFGMERSTTLLFFAHAGASLLALAIGKKRSETLLVIAIILGLMAPYVIMPNHVFGYYGIKWLAFQAIGLILLVRVIFGERNFVASIASIVIAGWIFLPSLGEVIEHRGRFANVASYMRTNMAISENLYQSMKDLQPELNQFDEINVVGIGPGGLIHTPWQGNGETAFYLRTDWGLAPSWKLYVTSAGPKYRLTPAGDVATSVKVAPIDELPVDPSTPVLMIGRDGSASLVTRDSIGQAATSVLTGETEPSKWLSSPTLEIDANPLVIETCVPGGRPRTTVSWDVSPSVPAGKVDIWVDNGVKRKLWLRGASKGTATTGPWVQGGVSFHIELATTHAKLASITLGGIRCN